MITKQKHSKELISQIAIDKRVTELAQQISSDYKKLTAIIILKGAMFFAVDLLRLLTIPVEIDTLSLGSYGLKGSKSGAVRINNDITIDIAGRDVLLIEDIVDSGKTILYLQGLFQFRNPASVKLCSFLSKPDRREFDVKIDYLGFEIPDKWVVGYGLDLNEKGRTLRSVNER